MPEGPEIHIAADKIANAIAGRVALDLFFAFDTLKPYQDQLSGQTIERVQAQGKAMLVRFANGLTIYSHNQLYGKWLIKQAYSYPKTNRQLRLAIHTHKKSALLYSASDIEVLRDFELDEHHYLSRLGPDVVNPEITLEQVKRQFYNKAFHRRRLTGLLLDQHFLAGLGNYLRSEILFVARVPPTLRPVDCSNDQILRLAEASLALARQSYQTKGITNSLALAKRLQQQGYTHNEYRFWVFNRQNQPCRVCSTPIVKDTLSGRRLYFCPACQAVA